MRSLIQNPGTSRGLFRTLTFILTLTLGTSLLLWGCGEEEEESTAAADMASGGGEGGSGGAAPAGDGSWGSSCEGDDNCMGESDYCVLNPMVEGPGYCSRECTQESDCAGAEMGWTCNVIGGCESPIVTWCGPASEVEENPGVLTACP